jgi:hypothetical protein
LLPQHPAFVNGRPPFCLLVSAFPPLQEWAKTLGRASLPINEVATVVAPTSELPKRPVSSFSINRNVALLEWTTRLRWIFYTFVAKDFQKIKYILYCTEYMKVQ